MFDTKDSGVRKEFASGMVRDTQEGKARFDLLFPKNVPYEGQMLTRFAELMARGADKYAERNWERADSLEELERAKGSALRHLIQWFNNETDEDHAAAVFFNIMAAEYVKRRIDADAFCITLANGECVSTHPLDMHRIEGDYAPLGDHDTPFSEDSAAPIAEPEPLMCETAGPHKCSTHITGWPV